MTSAARCGPEFVVETVGDTGRCVIPKKCKDVAAMVCKETPKGADGHY